MIGGVRPVGGAPGEGTHRHQRDDQEQEYPEHAHRVVPRRPVEVESKEGSIARAVVAGGRPYAFMHETASPGVGTTMDDERPRRAA